MQILLVDDCPDTTELFSFYLKERGHDSINATFIDAEKIFNENPDNFHSILINLDPRCMDLINNLENIAQLKNPNISIAYLTSGIELIFVDRNKIGKVNIIYTHQLLKSMDPESLLLNKAQ